MTSGIVIALVVLAAANAVMWLALRAGLGARLQKLRDGMTAELQRAGEPARTTGLVASYLGSTAEPISIRCSGVLLVTDQRVWFRRAIGPELAIPLASVARTLVESTFRGRPVRGSGAPTCLAIDLSDGTRVAFTLREIDEVRRAIGR